LTKDGVDCSGLVYTAFRSQGIRLPRDADQQALTGRLVATRWHRSSLRRGDVLFFLGRRGTIHHTAIYLGNNEILEATRSRRHDQQSRPQGPQLREEAR
jgi:cell wall-associated NlpC family hydrolase